MTAKDAGIRISFSEESHQGAKIKVIGVGGGGCNAVNRIFEGRGDFSSRGGRGILLRRLTDQDGRATSWLRRGCAVLAGCNLFG